MGDANNTYGGCFRLGLKTKRASSLPVGEVSRTLSPLACLVLSVMDGISLMPYQCCFYNCK